ncbi:MAG TPA: acetate kinase, partial [Allocoleopsis sp.]
MKILVLNAGSSSQKSSLYDLPDDRLPSSPLIPVWEGFIDWTHQQGVAEVKVKTAHGAEWQEAIPFEDRPPVVARMLATLWSGATQVMNSPDEIQTVGHRVVHGGRKYHDSVVITPDVKQTIAQLAELAPVHNPANLEGIEAAEQILGNVPQVAVFDTAFHAAMPDAARIYPGTYDWIEKGICRYGFHGTSHQYCAERAAVLLDRNLQDLKIITCHLGNG